MTYRIKLPYALFIKLLFAGVILNVALLYGLYSMEGSPVWSAFLLPGLPGFSAVIPFVTYPFPFVAVAGFLGLLPAYEQTRRQTWRTALGFLLTGVMYLPVFLSLFSLGAAAANRFFL